MEMILGGERNKQESFKQAKKSQKSKSIWYPTTYKPSTQVRLTSKPLQQGPVNTLASWITSGMIHLQTTPGSECVIWAQIHFSDFCEFSSHPWVFNPPTFWLPFLFSYTSIYFSTVFYHISSCILSNFLQQLRVLSYALLYKHIYIFSSIAPTQGCCGSLHAQSLGSWPYMNVISKSSRPRS